MERPLLGLVGLSCLAKLEGAIERLNVAAGLTAFFEVLLVVLLGPPEGLRRLDLRDDPLWRVTAGGGQFFDLGLRQALLVGGVNEDR